MGHLEHCIDREWAALCRHQHRTGIAGRWAQAEPVLAGYPTLEDILDACHDEDAPEVALAALGGLCRVAVDDPGARVAVLRAMRPGMRSMCGTHRRLARPGGPWTNLDELADHIATAITIRLLHPAGLSGQPHRQLLAYASWSVRTTARRQRVFGWNLLPQDSHPEVAAGDTRTHLDLAAAAISQATRAGHLPARQARVLYRYHIMDQGLGDIAQIEGVHRWTASLWVRAARDDIDWSTAWSDHDHGHPGAGSEAA